jgi:rhodanese-related sulfurtransferase
MGMAIFPTRRHAEQSRPDLHQGRSMPSNITISAEKLSRLIGTPNCPALIDVRPDDEWAAIPFLIPSALRRPHGDPSAWAAEFAGDPAVVICQDGTTLSHGVAAWLRHSGIAAEVLEGGVNGWRRADLPLATAARLPPLDRHGRTVWVTRSRPKIDRIACPWLIRRFMDPRAVFLFVAPSEVSGVARDFGATPFDVEDAFWSHRGDSCTFDVMIEEFGLATPPLLRLAAIVSAADMDRVGTVPQAAGLLAASLGLSRMFSDDLAQLEAGLVLYDAFYRWCRDAIEETHTVHGKRSEGRRTKLST